MSTTEHVEGYGHGVLYTNAGGASILYVKDGPVEQGSLAYIDPNISRPFELKIASISQSDGHKDDIRFNSPRFRLAGRLLRSDDKVILILEPDSRVDAFVRQDEPYSGLPPYSLREQR